MPYPTPYDQALEFYRALGLPIGDESEPADIPYDRLLLRLTLIGEEVAELVGAMVGADDVAVERMRTSLVAKFLDWASDAKPVDLAAIAKEAVDVHVVTSGSLVEYGIHEDAAAAEVHRSNMAKAGGPRRADGKILKPAGWTPPDVASAIGLSA